MRSDAEQTELEPVLPSHAGTQILRILNGRMSHLLAWCFVWPAGVCMVSKWHPQSDRKLNTLSSHELQTLAV